MIVGVPSGRVTWHGQHLWTLAQVQTAIATDWTRFMSLTGAEVMVRAGKGYVCLIGTEKCVPKSRQGGE